MGHDLDVAVLDLKMEDMDGIEVLKVFQKMAPEMPVIMLTGHGSAVAAEEGIALGACDYLTKPCSLEELVERNVNAERIQFTTSYKEALDNNTEFVFICVGTPSGVDGEADLKYVESAAKSIAENMTAPLIVINKSTVPVGTNRWVAERIKAFNSNAMEGENFDVVSNPEFLREGKAVQDFFHT